MTAIEAAEQSIERLNPQEFQEFLLWLSNRVSTQLGDALGVAQPSAQQQSAAHGEKIRSGNAEPFRYVDVDALPEAARQKARSMIAEWQTRYGS